MSDLPGPRGAAAGRVSKPPANPLRRLFASLLLLIATLGCLGRAPVAPPAFSVKAEPAAVRLLPGLGKSITLRLEAEPGFQGVVQLSAPGLEPGLRARFTPATVNLAEGTPGTVVLDLSAEEGLAPGKRTLLLQGASGTEAVATAELALDVPAVGFFSVLTYRGVDPGNFAYLAYQDGDGPWTAVPGNRGLYRLPVSDPEGRFGVLLGDVCQGEDASSWITNGFFSSLSEVQLLQALVYCNPEPGPPPVTFDLSGLLSGNAGRTVLVSANSGLWSFPPGTRDFALKLLKGGSDLLAAAYPDTGTYIPSRIIVERGRDVQAPATRDFDFAQQGTDTGATLPIQRPALEPDERFRGTVQVQTSRGQVVLLGYGDDLAAFAPFPASLTQPGDTWQFGFQADGAGRSRGLQASGTQPPGALAPRLPGSIPPFDLTTSGGPFPRLNLAWSAVTPAPAVHQAVITQQLGRKQAYAYLYFGSSWHRGASRLAWAQPDLAQVPGFDPGFFPLPGAEASVTLYQSGSQAGSASLPAALDPPPGTPVRRGGPRMTLRPLAAPGLRAQPLALGAWSESWYARRTQTVMP